MSNHGWTRHGHACCPEAHLSGRPELIARCGGPAICTKCALEAAGIHSKERVEEVPVPKAACRDCRRPIRYVLGVGWLHEELPQFIDEQRYPFTCENAVPLEERKT